MSENSFFFNNKLDFDYLVTDDVYVDYQQPLYKDEYSINKIRRRRKFLQSYDEWLDIPIENSPYTEDDNYYNESIKDEEILYGEENFTNTNREFVDSFYTAILDTITNNGYIINDVNQFKEDIAYFIYRLSNTK